MSSSIRQFLSELIAIIGTALSVRRATTTDLWLASVETSATEKASGFSCCSKQCVLHKEYGMKQYLAIATFAASILSACGGGDSQTQLGYSQEDAMAEPLGSIAASGIYLSPQQVRTRYGFDQLPSSPEARGSGQVIAIISAYNYPYYAENLAAFSAKFGLPQCAAVSTVYTTPPDSYTTANFPKPVPGSGCSIQVINVDSFGRPTRKVPQGGPAVAQWAAEASMDIEWAHAMAPDASIVVVQAVTPFPGALSFAAQYAGNNGASAVSMSWGMAENSIQCTRRPGQPTVKYDPSCSDVDTAARFWAAFAQKFSNPDVTFVAASGDRGVIQWPANNPTVLAVGGTNFGISADTGWQYSGGGFSQSFVAPSWQSAVLGTAMRAIPDVAYDAGTAIAVYVKPDVATGFPDSSCITANAGNSDRCGWYGGGGTSAGAPQWAALSAIVRATRSAKGVSPIIFAPALYRDIASIPGRYASAFGDVTSGGTSSNPAKSGYDTLTGLGIPNASVLTGYLGM